MRSLPPSIPLSLYPSLPPSILSSLPPYLPSKLEPVQEQRGGDGCCLSAVGQPASLQPFFFFSLLSFVIPSISYSRFEQYNSTINITTAAVAFLAIPLRQHTLHRESSRLLAFQLELQTSVLRRRGLSVPLFSARAPELANRLCCADRWTGETRQT